MAESTTIFIDLFHFITRVGDVEVLAGGVYPQFFLNILSFLTRVGDVEVLAGRVTYFPPTIFFNVFF